MIGAFSTLISTVFRKFNVYQRSFLNSSNITMSSSDLLQEMNILTWNMRLNHSALKRIHACAFVRESDMKVNRRWAKM